MKAERINGCCIVALCDYRSVSIKLDTPTVTDADFEKYYNDELKYDDSLSDQIIQEQFGYNNINEYKKALREEYEEHLRIVEIFSAREEILDYLIANSKFELDEEEVANYAKEIVFMSKNEAIMNGYDDLDEYIENELNISKEQFFSQCTEKGKYEICTYLVIGAIAEREKLEIPKGEDIYETYQNMENKVYSIFLETDSDF